MSASGEKMTALNIEQRLFMDADGFTHPVVNWMDANGLSCEPEDAIVCVAGSEGRWFALVVADYTGEAA